MIGLILLIVACVLIHKKAQEFDKPSWPYILSSIALMLLVSVPSVLIGMSSLAAVIITSIISGAICFLPLTFISEN